MYRWHCAGKLYEDYTSNPMPNPHPSKTGTESMDCTGGAGNTLSLNQKWHEIVPSKHTCTSMMCAVGDSWRVTCVVFSLACTLPSLHLGTVVYGMNMAMSLYNFGLYVALECSALKLIHSVF